MVWQMPSREIWFAIRDMLHSTSEMVRLSMPPPARPESLSPRQITRKYLLSDVSSKRLSLRLYTENQELLHHVEGAAVFCGCPVDDIPDNVSKGNVTGRIKKWHGCFWIFNYKICLNIVNEAKVPLTYCLCANCTKCFKKTKKRTLCVWKTNKVIHIQKRLISDKRHLYTELCTLSTAFHIKKYRFDCCFFGTNVLWSSNKNRILEKYVEILVDRYNVKKQIKKRLNCCKTWVKCVIMHIQ